MKIKEIKEHEEYSHFVEVTFEEIPERVFTVSLERCDTMVKFRRNLNKRYDGYVARKLRESQETTPPTLPELKESLKGLVGQDIKQN